MNSCILTKLLAQEADSSEGKLHGVVGVDAQMRSGGCVRRFSGKPHGNLIYSQEWLSQPGVTVGVDYHGRIHVIENSRSNKSHLTAVGQILLGGRTDDAHPSL